MLLPAQRRCVVHIGRSRRVQDRLHVGAFQGQLQDDDDGHEVDGADHLLKLNFQETALDILCLRNLKDKLARIIFDLLSMPPYLDCVPLVSGNDYHYHRNHYHRNDHHPYLECVSLVPHLPHNISLYRCLQLLPEPGSEGSHLYQTCIFYRLIAFIFA